MMLLYSYTTDFSTIVYIGKSLRCKKRISNDDFGLGFAVSPLVPVFFCKKKWYFIKLNSKKILSSCLFYAASHAVRSFAYVADWFFGYIVLFNRFLCWLCRLLLLLAVADNIHIISALLSFSLPALHTGWTTWCWRRALQRKSHYVFPEKELRGLSPNFHIHVSVSDLYISIIGPHIFLQQNRQTESGNI